MTSLQETKEKEELHVFICENDEVAQEIIQKYFKKGWVSYAALFPTERRTEITEALDKIQD